MVSCEIRLIGTGKAPAFKRVAKSFASCKVKLPVITALPSGITDWTVGALMGEPSR